MIEMMLLDGVIPVNCYFITYNKECYIVDPGFEKDRVVEYIDKNNLTVKGILLTHGHIDHIGAIDAFDVPVYLHQEELPILLDNHLNGFEYYGQEKTYKLEDIDLVPLSDGDSLLLAGREIQVIHTPGHTVGCVCYRLDEGIITGDTLFKETVGRWEFPTGDQSVLRQSIIDFLENNDEDCVLYPAHGLSTTVGHERRKNPFYLAWKRYGLIK